LNGRDDAALSVDRIEDSQEIEVKVPDVHLWDLTPLPSKLQAPGSEIVHSSMGACSIRSNPLGRVKLPIAICVAT
jgi:hypothetical protein